MRRLVVFFALALFGCDRYPPTAMYVGDAPPSVKAADPMYGDYEIALARGTAVGVVFLVNDKSTASGTRPGTDAVSLNDAVARVLPTDDEKSVKDGPSHYEGRVFVVVGVAPGDTSFEIFQDGESRGTIAVHVLAPE